VITEDIEEIRNNLQEARLALNNANYSKVLLHINNIDQFLTTFVVNNSLSINNSIQNNDSAAIASLNNNSSIVEEYKKIN
jgi:hypothetical protein